MYWRRKLVDWSPVQPELLGLQSTESLPVDFGKQVGVYLLHDRDRVIYVGRATDRLVVRLRSHITDRLGGRWDRFSWFGLLDVNEEGELVPESVPWTQEVAIETLEALLIESLEPPLNRRRGDNFSAVEYLQARRVDIADPGI
jgi:excinuclease UvrABC nuclease subunit